MTDLKSTDCRAANPATCRYHGAVLRMEKALASQDIEAYVKARDEVDALKKDKNNDFHAFARTQSVSITEVTGDRKSREEQKQRRDFLAATAAVPTPMEAHALWLTVYENQGGKITYFNKVNYNSFKNVISEDPQIKEKALSYDSLAWSRWTPTKPGISIPAGHGSSRLQLFLLPEVVDQPLHRATIRRNGHLETRPGWEWGHTEVFSLTHDDRGFLIAETNTTKVSTYEDIEKYRKNKSVAELAEAFRKANFEQQQEISK